VRFGTQKGHGGGSGRLGAPDATAGLLSASGRPPKNGARPHPPQVQPVHPLLTVGAAGINASCRGMTKPPARPLPAEQTVATAPRFQVSYVLNPVQVPPPPAPDSVDKFVARYGAANATINPDMAEAEVARQIAKLQELTVSTNATVADSARKALQAYATQQRLKAEEEARERQEVLAQEAAAARGKWGKSAPLQRNVVVGEYASVNPPPRIRLEGLESLQDVGWGWGWARAGLGWVWDPAFGGLGGLGVARRPRSRGRPCGRGARGWELRAGRV
jgi:hypothetical protein